jgi:hypothetical protein
VSNAAITVVNSGANAFEGVYTLRHPDGLLGVYTVRNTNIVPTIPGQNITGRCRYRRETNVTGRQTMTMVLFWLNSSMVDLSQSIAEYPSGGTGVWYDVSVTGVAPAGAAYVQIGIYTFQTGTGGTHHQYFDSFTWDYVQPVAQTGLVYQAVQADAGFTAATEPVWPVVLGNTVVDNEVTWEAVLASNVTWEATPILLSGATEPTFPTEVGGTVLDNTVAWKAISRRIVDENCPNSKVVTIAASKVFAADRDIIRFSATVNPLDWTTSDDAGYLPFGLQTYGANPVAAMGLYRSNLVAFNSQGFQMWQVDQDPQNMAFLDAVPVGSTFVHSIQPVANDLLLLTSVGSRNLSIAGASTNLQAEGVGEPIDSLVKAEIRLLASPDDALSLFWPAMGQYWIIFGDEAFVLTINGAKKKSWSRYVFPEDITAMTLDGDTLVLRTETGKVWEMDDESLKDDENAPTSTVTITIASPAVVSWTANGLQNGDPVVFTTTGALPTGLVASTTYYVVSVATNSFSVAATVGGTAINTSGSQSGVHTALAATGTDFEGVIWWPYLDMGALGVEKMLIGLDVVCDAPGGVSVSIGYNQNDRTQRTTDYEVDPDTLTGQMVPFPVSGPSFDLKLTFAANQEWEWEAANLYIQDWRRGA